MCLNVPGAFLCLLDWWYRCYHDGALPIPHQTWPCSALLTSSCCHLIPMPGASSGSWSPSGQYQGIQHCPPPTPTLNAFLEGDWHIRHPSSTLSSVFSAVTARDPTRWIVGAHSGYLLHDALFIGCLCLREVFLPRLLRTDVSWGHLHLHLCLKSASKTKPQQLAEFSASRASPLSNGCWLCIHKGCLCSWHYLIPAGKESARTVIWSKYIIPHPACEFIGDREILLDLLFLIHQERTVYQVPRWCQRVPGSHLNLHLHLEIQGVPQCPPRRSHGDSRLPPGSPRVTSAFSPLERGQRNPTKTFK